MTAGVVQGRGVYVPSACVLMFLCVKEGAVICRCGVVWCCRPSWLPVAIFHQGDQGWGMLPWDYPVRVTWSGSNAFKGHGFCVFLCVAQCVKRGLWVHSRPPPESWPECELSPRFFLSFFCFVFCPSLHPSSHSTDLRGKPHISPGCLSHSASISPNQMFKSCLFVFATLWLMPTIKLCACWCCIPLY